MTDSPVDTLELFHFIESSFDVSKFDYCGMNFWPLIRSRIAYQLSFSIPKGDYNFPKREKNISYFIKKPVRQFSLKNKKRKFVNKLTPLKEEVQVCTYPDKLYIDELEGKRYSRYIDPYYEILYKNYRTGRLGFYEDEKPVNLYWPINFCPISEFKAYYEQKKYIDSYSDLLSHETEKIKKAFREANLLTIEKFKIEPFFNLLIAEFNDVVYFKEYFTELLKKSNVKYIFLECFYDTLKMALCAAAKEKNIKTIELQHGVISDYAYIPYLNHNVNYSIMPDYLWCWSSTDKNKILEENGLFKYLRPFVGGNMWLKKFKDMEISSYSKSDAIFFEDARSHFKKVLVYTHQPNLHSDIIIDFILNSPDDYLILLRFHPMTGNYEKQMLLNRIGNKVNVETKRATELNLYALFMNCDLHLTHSSVTAVEALAFGVPSVICSEAGREFFKEYIENGVMFYARSLNEINNAIENKGIDPEKLKNYSISTDTKLTLKNLEVILN